MKLSYLFLIITRVLQITLQLYLKLCLMFVHCDRRLNFYTVIQYDVLTEHIQLHVHPNNC